MKTLVKVRKKNKDRVYKSGVGSMNYRHGMQDSTEYHIWCMMKQRCHNPKNTGYGYYGGRGIKVCARWRKSFTDFYSDMGARPAGKSLDRIDNNGDYTPENCKWSTRWEQQKNTRRNNPNPGIYWSEDRKRWRVQLSKKFIGNVKTFEEAVALRKEAERAHNV